jgi:hypothetical protein
MVSKGNGKMSDSYLLGVQIETPEGKFVDNGILKVGKDDLKLINSGIKGIALGGLLESRKAEQLKR